MVVFESVFYFMDHENTDIQKAALQVRKIFKEWS